MKRDKEELKGYLLEEIRNDERYEDGDLNELEQVVKNDENLNSEQRSLVEDVLEYSLKKKLEKIQNEKGSSFILEIDALSIYPDILEEYYLKRG